MNNNWNAILEHARKFGLNGNKIDERGVLPFLDLEMNYGLLLKLWSDFFQFFMNLNVNSVNIILTKNMDGNIGVLHCKQQPTPRLSL